MRNRKEHTTKESFFGIPGTDHYKTKLYDNSGRRSEGRGNTKSESRERAYKRWREKYK